VTGLYVVIAMVVLAGSLTLLCHPLLRFLKVSEVPAALLIVFSGRPNRRRLLYVLRSRRQVYLDDIAGLPPEYLRVVLAWRTVMTRLAGLARRSRSRLGFAWKNGPLVAPPKEKKLAAGRYPVPDREHVADALGVARSSVSVRGIGPGFEVSVRSFDDILGDVGDWRDRLPAHRNPWAGQVDPELAAHRARMAEIAWNQMVTTDHYSPGTTERVRSDLPRAVTELVEAMARRYGGAR
jgi:hypothetical protein